MFVGRVAERKTLEEIYRNNRSNLVVLYGRTGIGKTELVREFLQNKRAFYYLAQECTQSEQLRLMSGLVREDLDPPTDFIDWFEQILAVSNKDSEKHLIVLDEFHFAAKKGNLSDAICNLLRDGERFGRVMLLLVSSQVEWIENEMVQDLGMAAKFISSFLKLKELSFMEMGEWFPNFSVEKVIAVNAVIGGIPLYLKLWDDKKTVEQNIERLFIADGAPLLFEAERVLKSGLRELGAYNSILSALALGKHKLNELYIQTGFSRAKISVYLKNLIRMDLVEKVFSADTNSHENVLKGLYRIKDNFLCFWYRFIYQNRTKISLVQEGTEVRTIINRNLFEYQRESFSQLCLEYLKLMCRHKRLQCDYDLWGSWYGKQGRLDVIAQESNPVPDSAVAERSLAAYCFWEERSLNREKMVYVQELVRQAKLNPNEVFVFTKLGVEQEVEKEFSKSETVRFVALKDL